jgi:hypothetical protein
MAVDIGVAAAWGHLDIAATPFNLRVQVSRVRPMKLKTRLALAYGELALAAATSIGMVALNLTRPLGTLGLAGAGVGALVSALIFGPLCYAAWKRLGRIRAEIVAFGPDAASSVSPWVAPRISGVLGVLILVAALFVALAPALLLG